MTILVTGGAGFVGSHFIARMTAETDARLVCLDNFNDYYDPSLKRNNASKFDASRVTLIEGDFCDAELNEKVFQEHQITHVVHLGAYAGVRYSVDHPDVYVKNNVQGTLALLETARKYPVDRFLLISSSTVYGKGAAVPFDESASLGVPASPYGASKRAAELLGLTYASLHDVPVVCLRPFSVYGPGLRPDLALSIFTRAIVRQIAFPLFGDGTIRRDLTHVADICAGLHAALDADNIVGEEINLGHSEPIEVREIIAELESAVGRKAIIDQQPERPEDLPVTCASLAKAQRLLGYQPTRSYKDGIPEFVEWYLRWHEPAASR